MNCAIPPGQSRVMDINHQTAQPETKAPVQLQLAGLETTPVGIDPRFILSDEVCRNVQSKIVKGKIFLDHLKTEDV